MEAKGQKGERMCVACRAHSAPDEFIRIVKTADGVIIDCGGKADGRGAYICKNAKCAQLCKKRHGLNRALKTEVDETIYDELILLCDKD